MKDETNNNIKKRGFASFTPERRKECASLGGKAVSANREHMAAIGRKGGAASGRRNLTNEKGE